MKKILTLILGTVVLITGCRKDDIEKPTISVTNPLDGAIIQAGSELDFVAIFRDNRELSQYKIDIHEDFDDHAHKMSYEPWSFQQIYKIEGKEENVHHHINIPSTAAAGKYHLQIQCTDEVGNEAELVILEITIQNPDDLESPVLTITSPAEGSVTTVAKGGSFNLTGTATDNKDLKELTIQLISENNSGSIIYTNDIDFTGTSDITAAINETITIPSTAGGGNYHLKVIAKDAVFNTIVKEFEVVVQ